VKLPVGVPCPRFPDEMGLSIPISSPVINNARCLLIETMTRALSGVIL
jgi:hypothetical protein